HAPGPLAQLHHGAALHPDRRPLAGERLRLAGAVTGEGRHYRLDDGRPTSTRRPAMVNLGLPSPTSVVRLPVRRTKELGAAVRRALGGLRQVRQQDQEGTVVAKSAQIALGIGLSLLGVICLLTLSLIAGIVGGAAEARPPSFTAFESE